MWEQNCHQNSIFHIYKILLLWLTQTESSEFDFFYPEIFCGDAAARKIFSFLFFSSPALVFFIYKPSLSSSIFLDAELTLETKNNKLASVWMKQEPITALIYS